MLIEPIVRFFTANTQMKPLTSLIFLLLALPALAKEQVLWVKWALTPEYIQEGEFADQGYVDKMLSYVQAGLPEYDHQVQYQTGNRLARSWQQGNVCTVHLWLGYWPDLIVYSKPYAFTPHYGIVVRANSSLAKEYKGRESIRLKELLDGSSYRIGMLPLFIDGSRDSRYPQLVPLIEPYLDSDSILEFRNNRNEMSVDYLNKHRVDGILRQRITHFGELKVRQLDNDYRFFFIEEGRRHKLVAAACSNSPLGHEVITKIDKMIDQDFYLRYLKFRQEWDPQNARFDEVFVGHFLQQKHFDFVHE